MTENFLASFTLSDLIRETSAGCFDGLKILKKKLAMKIWLALADKTYPTKERVFNCGFSLGK